MKTVRRVAHAIGSTGSTAPAYRVAVRVGAHELVADEPTFAGGVDVGPSPFGLVVGALAACAATTLRIYAERKDWELATIAVDVRYDVGDDGRARSSERSPFPLSSLPTSSTLSCRSPSGPP